jgi:hypothetical protein
MYIENFIIELFYRIENAMRDQSKHPHSDLCHDRAVKVVILLVNKEVANRPSTKRSEIAMAGTPEYC